MRQVTVPLPGDVSYTYRDFFGGPVGGVVGNPAWNDESDSSYAELYVTCHPDASFTDQAGAVVQATDISRVPTDPSRVSVYIQVRAQSITSTGAERPLRASIFTTSSGGLVSIMSAAAAPPATPEWIEVGPMPFAGSPDFLGFLDGIANGTTQVRVTMTENQDVADFTYPGMRAFEVRLILEMAGAYAPPCRNIKRGDVLDLGGARNYPPSKMTQTSSRGVGAY